MGNFSCARDTKALNWKLFFSITDPSNLIVNPRRRCGQMVKIPIHPAALFGFPTLPRDCHRLSSPTNPVCSVPTPRNSSLSGQTGVRQEINPNKPPPMYIHGGGALSDIPAKKSSSKSNDIRPPESPPIGNPGRVRIVQKTAASNSLPDGIPMAPSPDAPDQHPKVALYQPTILRRVAVDYTPLPDVGKT